jgi:hypothetical protein
MFLKAMGLLFPLFQAVKDKGPGGGDAETGTAFAKAPQIVRRPGPLGPPA